MLKPPHKKARKLAKAASKPLRDLGMLRMPVPGTAAVDREMIRRKKGRNKRRSA